MIYTVTFNPAIDYHMYTTSTNQLTKTEIVPGGKGINVSLVLQTMNVPNKALGFVGGSTGELFQQVCNEAQLNSSFTPISDSTRLNHKWHTPFETREFNAMGPVVRTEEYELLLNQVSQCTSEDILVCSGSVAQGKATTYQPLLELCNRNKIPFIIDTTKTELMQSLQYQPLLVKPNIYELEELFQTTITSIDDIVTYGTILRQKGAQNVLISQGEQGSVLISNEAIWVAEPMDITPINTVGAGDAMVAGFVYGYRTSQSLFDRYKTAVAFASAQVTHIARPTVESIEKYQVIVTINEYKKNA